MGSTCSGDHCGRHGQTTTDYDCTVVSDAGKTCDVSDDYLHSLSVPMQREGRRTLFLWRATASTMLLSKTSEKASTSGAGVIRVMTFSMSVTVFGWIELVRILTILSIADLPISPQAFGP